MLWLALLPLAAAGTYDDDFASDAGMWAGGTVADGLLTITDDEALLDLGGLASLEGTIRLRKSDEGSVTVKVGEATWTAAYSEGGAITLGDDSLPFPYGHRSWRTESDPVLEPDDAEYWEAGSVLHTDVHHDDTTATWFLYYTGEMAPGYGYRQIGLATSADGETWTRYDGNPVITIDYDTTTEDGIHVHQPTVVVDPSDAGWHMYYACYQNDVGNRICHATSTDGMAWTPQGVVLDQGADGEFDSESLREPDVQIDDDGTWHMLYIGTQPGEHYGPTGYATSTDGEIWTKHGEIIGTGASDLQGGGMVQSAYGVEQWFNCDDAFCFASADPSDWTDWTRDGTAVLTKNWETWNSGYIQAPSPWLVDGTYHLWFNAYDYGAAEEVLAHATSQPDPGAWMELSLAWDGEQVEVRIDGGPVVRGDAGSADGLALVATGTVEVDDVSVRWEIEDGGIDSGDPGDGDSGDGGSGDGDSGDGDSGDSGSGGNGPADSGDGGSSDSAADPGAAPDGGSSTCGCGGSQAWVLLFPAALLIRRGRAGSADREGGPSGFVSHTVSGSKASHEDAGHGASAEQ